MRNFKWQLYLNLCTSYIALVLELWEFLISQNWNSRKMHDKGKKEAMQPPGSKLVLDLFTRTTFCPLYSSQLLFLALTTTCLAPLWLRQNLPGVFSQLLLSLYSTWFKMKLVCGLFTISFFLFCISCNAKTTHKPKIIELCPSKVPKVNGTFKHELTTLRQAIEEVGSRSELR